MTHVAEGESMDIYDTFESDITLAAAAVSGELRFRLERPDGTLAADWIYGTNPEISVLSGNKYHAEFRVDQEGIWYYEWKPDGSQAALAQGWFIVEPQYIGVRGETSVPSSSIPLIKSIEETFDLVDFVDNGAYGSAQFSTPLPIGGIPIAVKFNVTEGFVGDGVCGLALGIGSGTEDHYVAMSDDEGAFADAQSVDVYGGQGPAATMRSISQLVRQMYVQVQGTALFANITQGSVTVTVYYLQAI